MVKRPLKGGCKKKYFEAERVLKEEQTWKGVAFPRLLIREGSCGEMDVREIHWVPQSRAVHITRQQETIFQCTDEPRLASGYTEGVRVFRTCSLAEGCSLQCAVSMCGGS